MKVGILSPDYGGKCTTGNKFTHGSDRLWLHMNGHEEMCFAQDRVDISTVRNKAMQIAIESNCDRLLMVDSDVSMMGGISSLEHLMPVMDEKGCAIAGIPVMLRRESTNAQGTVMNTVNCSPVFAGEIYQGRIATGIVLIDVKQIAENIEKPFFFDERNPDNTTRVVTQDMYFCDKVLAAGLTSYVVFTVPSSHAARPEYTTKQMILDKYHTTKRASR